MHFFEKNSSKAISQLKVCKKPQIRIYNKKMGAEARRKGELKNPSPWSIYNYYDRQLKKVHIIKFLEAKKNIFFIAKNTSNIMLRNGGKKPLLFGSDSELAQ